MEKQNGMFKKKVLSSSLAVHPMCFCSFRVKCVCYVPIYSPLNVMEPRHIREITPPTLLALSTAGSRVLQLWALYAHMHILLPPTSPLLSGKLLTFAVEVWERVQFFRYTSLKNFFLHLLKMQIEGRFAFKIHPLPLPPLSSLTTDKWISFTKIALDLPTQLSFKSYQRKTEREIYVTVKKNTSLRVSYTKWLWGFISIILYIPSIPDVVKWIASYKSNLD